MTDIGAKVYTLCKNSSLETPSSRHSMSSDGVNEWLRSGEFVKLSDYEVALKRILELETLLDQPEEDYE